MQYAKIDLSKPNPKRESKMIYKSPVPPSYQ
jgi:hypothetical protein